MGDLGQLAGPILLFAVFIIFFIVLPQRKKIKQEKEFDASLKVGAKVVTKSGLHGKVVTMNNDGTCIIESGAGKLKFERSAISIEMTKSLNKTVVAK
ncbi:preprotein translocase subunit YajC [Dokdonia sinensis]|uniref:Sec translocon accessory complex subunit YajC n=1 Tax=Dokdonia sinensis TaxID=2479847 RepID=A0A3M0G9N6_9FLAO|nr:preprotein translocase subunit YajC [Dokdonia sinensis]RMB60957.1 preprotein translocase subunit YajC [Dokdonia sinensis]